MSWYENNRKYDIDISKIQPTGALAAKAIGDSFKDIATIIEDREKTNMAKEEHAQKQLMNAYDLDEKKDKQSTRKSTKAYEQFVDPKTGTFDKEGFVLAYGEDELKKVPWSVKQNIYNVQNAYNQNEINKKVGYGLSKAENKKEFWDSLDQEDKKNLNPDAVIKYQKYFDDQKNQEANLKLAQEKQTMDKQDKDKKATEDIPVGYYNSIYAQTAKRFGGFLNDDGSLRALAKGTEKMVTDVSSIAEKIYKANPDNGISGAVALAVEEYEQKKNSQQIREKTPVIDQEKNFKKLDNILGL